MADYPIGMELVVDPDNPMNVVVNGSVGIYAPEDTAGTTLLALKDANGFPLANPLTSNAYGFLPPFLPPIPQVRWISGEFTGFYNSFIGLRDEAVAAKNAAQDAQAEAASAGANAAEVAQEALSGAVGNAQTAQAAATNAAAAAAAAQAAAEAAAATAVGGGVAPDPTDPDVILITTKTDGSVAIDPSDADALVITT